MQLLSKSFFGISLVFLLGSCSFFQDNNALSKLSDKKLVSVYDAELRESELSSLMATNSLGSDSSDYAQMYIQQWIQEQLWLNEGRKNNQIDHNLIENRVKAYRNQLLLHQAQQSYINSRLDSIITSLQAEEYYSSHKKDLLLFHPIIKTIIIKIDKRAKQRHQLRSLLKNYSPQKLPQIVDICNTYAESCHSKADVWFNAQVLLSNTAFEDLSQTTITQGFFKEKIDKQNIHFIKVIDYRKANQTSPLVYAYPQVRNLILNQRKKELKERYSQELYEKALNDNEIEFKN